MGIYQKIGIREVAINIVDRITFIRHYGFKNGYNIYNSLRKSKNGYFKIKSDLFKNEINLRDNFSDKAIFYQVFYERQYFLDRLLAINPGHIIDAGANIGLASLYFSNLYPNCEIIAIEPQEDNFSLLEQNTKAYNNIKCIKAALWSKEENIQIANPDSLAASFIVEKSDKETLKGITINKILEDYKWESIDILKMDIEGAEKEIFSNDISWLKKVGLLIIELHDNYKQDCTKTFFKALESYNYEALFHNENIFIFFK